MQTADPAEAVEDEGHGVWAVEPDGQYVFAAHCVAKPLVQKDPAGHRDAVPLMHTLFEGHALHSQPPRGLDGLMILRRPATQTHCPLIGSELSGHAHCAGSAVPASEYRPWGQLTVCWPPAQYELAGHSVQLEVP